MFKSKNVLKSSFIRKFKIIVNSRLTEISRLFDNKKYSNDISIVFTETPFTINDYVRPAALPRSSKFEIDIARTVVSGTI